MNVKELIEKLKGLEQDKEVMYDAYGYYSDTPINEIVEGDYETKKIYVLK